MKILMRASQSPFDNISPLDSIIYDKIWDNVGNLLFPFGLYRNILSEDVTIDICPSIPSVADADFINENYDMILIPLANAIRDTYVTAFKKWTELIKAVKIPCVVAGIGIQCDLNFSSQTKFFFDDIVKEFFTAVASKSTCIGVRGELTYEYLKRLGFGDVTRVIGCPSMFAFGSELPKHRAKANGTGLKVSVNGKNGDNDKLKRYLFNEDNDYIFIPQRTSEFALAYSGRPIDMQNNNNTYPLNIGHKVFTNDRVRICVNVPSWLKLLQSVDLSIGTRIHGTIAAVLAGTPAFLLATDARTLELARYHNIHFKEIKDFDFSKSIQEIYEETDFTAVYKGHKERYENFADFLRVNGITPIEQPNAYFDNKINAIDYFGPVKNILKVSESEVVQRLNGYYSHLQKKINNQDKTIKELKKEKQEFSVAAKKFLHIN